MQEKQYIPGIDWIKIIGPFFVVMAHYGVFLRPNWGVDGLNRLMNTLIPVIFIISGYLAGRNRSWAATRKRVVRYGTLYMAIELCAVLYLHLADLRQTGVFSFTGFFVHSLKCLFYSNGLTYQLWFVPCLLYPMIVNTFLDEKKRRVLLAASAALLLAVNAVGYDKLCAIGERLTGACPLLLRVTKPEEMALIVTRYATGFLYTTLGFALVKVRIRPLHLLAALPAAAVFELKVVFLGLTPALLSVLLFWCIVKVPGRFLYPYHRQINLFAVTMFFLHVTEKEFITRYITENVFLNIVIITALNLLLTVLLSRLIERRKALKRRNAPEAL